MPALLHKSAARTWLVLAPAVLLVLGAVFFSAGRAHSWDDTAILLATSETVLGHAISYPTQGTAKVTAVIVEMQPGEEAGWHAHDVPMFGYILEGEVTVNYGPHGTRVYRAGDAVMEAIDLAHDGQNSGVGVARILAVFMGADGVPNTVWAAEPDAQ